MKDYAISIVPLEERDGGGFVGLVVDLPGCMSDGETREEALANTVIAISDWIETATKLGRPVPKPGAFGRYKRRREKKFRKSLEDLARSAESLELKVSEMERRSLLHEAEGDMDEHDEWYMSTVPGLVAMSKEHAH